MTKQEENRKIIKIGQLTEKLRQEEDPKMRFVLFEKRQALKEEIVQEKKKNKEEAQASSFKVKFA